MDRRGNRAIRGQRIRSAPAPGCVWAVALYRAAPGRCHPDGAPACPGGVSSGAPGKDQSDFGNSGAPGATGDPGRASGGAFNPFLTTRAGEPFTAAGFTGWFRDRCREAGLPIGLLGAWLAQGHMSPISPRPVARSHQIAAISGHATLREVETYTKAANQKRLAAAAMEVISGGTNTGKPIGKVSQRESQLIENEGSGNETGDPGRARTCDLPLRRRLLYPAELRSRLPEGNTGVTAQTPKPHYDFGLFICFAVLSSLMRYARAHAFSRGYLDAILPKAAQKGPLGGTWKN